MRPTYRDHRISVIYLITCLVNGKIYVGSATDFHNRWHGYRKYGRPDTIDGRLIERAIKKHGFDNFEFEILEHVPDKTQLIAREQHWLDTLRPWDRKVGYNIQHIADSPIGIKRSLETRLLRCRPVVQIDPATEVKLMEYESIKAAAWFLSIGMGTISGCCSGKVRTAGGFFWCYKDVFEAGKCRYRKALKPPHREFYEKIKPIYQLHLDGSVVKIWACKEDIRRETDFNIAGVWKCCVGQGKTAYNYGWQFVTEPGIIEGIRAERKRQYEQLVEDYADLKAAA